MSTLNVGTVTTTGKELTTTIQIYPLTNILYTIVMWELLTLTLKCLVLNRPTDGSSAAKAASSAEAIKAANPGLSGTGLYWIKINTIPNLHVR